MLLFTESDNAELHETDIIAQTLFTKKHFCVIISANNGTALPFGTGFLRQCGKTASQILLVMTSRPMFCK